MEVYKTISSVIECFDVTFMDVKRWIITDADDEELATSIMNMEKKGDYYFVIFPQILEANPNMGKNIHEIDGDNYYVSEKIPVTDAPKVCKEDIIKFITIHLLEDKAKAEMQLDYLKKAAERDNWPEKNVVFALDVAHSRTVPISKTDDKTDDSSKDDTKGPLEVASEEFMEFAKNNASIILFNNCDEPEILFPEDRVGNNFIEDSNVMQYIADHFAMLEALPKDKYGQFV